MNDAVQQPRDIVISVMKGAVPERAEELDQLWEHYNPTVELVNDTIGITLNACERRIRLDAKTMDVFWLIGFSGWRAIECYSPHVKCSASSGQPVSTLLQNDEKLDEVECAYKERLATVQSIINTRDPSSIRWPDDLPRPNPDREAFDSPQYKAAFDLTVLAVAFTLFHEFRHVMLDADNKRHDDRREEELDCDVWAREFMTAKLAVYAKCHGYNYHEVLRKRSMGLLLAALILHEITPFMAYDGNEQYFSVGDRFRAILGNTPLPDNDYFWVFASSILIGIFRQRGTLISAASMRPRELSEFLLSGL